MAEKAGMTGLVIGLLVGMFIAVTLFRVAPAESHGVNHREVVKVQGTGFCAEDERLAPVWHHGYNSESVSGWVYACKPFSEKGHFVR